MIKLTKQEEFKKDLLNAAKIGVGIILLSYLIYSLIVYILSKIN